MLRTFIFNEIKSQWIEEEHNLLLNDICVILDEEKEIIYLWNGPKSKKRKFRKSFKQLKELISTFPKLNIQYVMVSKNFPENVKDRVNSMIESIELAKGKVLNFSRFTTIRIYSVSIIITVFLPVLYLLNLFICLFWPIFDGNYQVSNIIFNNWINNSKILIIISIIFFIINILIGIIEKETNVIVFSLSGLIISFGLIIYLNQGIYLFLFQEGSTLTNYLILSEDIYIFLMLNFIAILIFEIPNLYKLISFFRIYHKFIF